MAVAITLLGCGRIGFDSVCAIDEPCVSRVVINSGARYATGPRLAVMVTTTGTEVRVATATGPCVFADDGWQPYTSGAVNWIVVEPSDGDKKVCVWARDARGKVSTIDREIAGVNIETVTFEAEHPPIVEAFEAKLVAGMLQVSWTVVDAEGFADGPVELDYATTRDQWLPLASDLGDMGGTRQTGTANLALPTSEPFLVRIAARDRAGNRGTTAVSDLVNAVNWSVYMSSNDHGVGGAALAARLEHGENSVDPVAIDPITHDVYAADDSRGVVRLDAATGVVERFISRGPLNLPDDGPLTAASSVEEIGALRFGPDHKLYLAPKDTYFVDDTSGVIYQIDPVTRHCRRYIGGGTANNANATATTVFVFPWVLNFDEDGSLYFLTSCTPGNTDPEPRIMKVTQTSDGKAGTFSIVAGNCVAGARPAGGPYDPLTTPLDGFRYLSIGSIVPWDRGRVIYYVSAGSPSWKILDGQAYSSNITAPGGVVALNATTRELYAANDNIVVHTPNLAGANGDSLTRTVVSDAGQGACTVDGVEATQACVHVQFGLLPTPDRLYFLDGLGLNHQRAYRVRYVDSGGRVRTYLGTPQFHGDGLDRRVARGRFGGIHYKVASDPNQAAFPAGLYFVDWLALVLGHVDEAGRVSILFGNQSGAPNELLTGATIGSNVSLGSNYGGGNMQMLAFDTNGLPWLRFGPNPSYAHLIRLDSARRVVRLQNGTTDWEDAVDGSNPANVDLWPYGGLSNLTLKDQAIFLVGGFLGGNPILSVKMIDFAGGTVTRLMGAAGNTFTADRPTPGTVTTASVSASCGNSLSKCFTAYRADQDRLYFSENERLRYITTPSTPSTSTLVTLFQRPPGSDIYNFSFRPDGSQLFFIGPSGALHCHDISSGALWCNDTALGPPAILGPIGRGADQLTWKDNQTLLISTHGGEILQYALPL